MPVTNIAKTAVSHTNRKSLPQLLYKLRWPLAIAAVLWLVKIAIIIVYPIEDLGTTSWLIDDSFIMASIARNLVTGCGYSFDCVQPTSGAPLTWTLITAPHHALFDLTTAMKITVIASAFVGGLCTIAVFNLTRHLYNSRVAWGAFLLSSLSLSLFFTPMNGMETSLFALLGLLSITVYVVHIRGQHTAPMRSYLLLGTLLGLLNLTRGDGIFLTGAIFFAETLLLISVHSAQRKDRFIRLAVLVITTGSVTSIVVLWALYADGVLLPANQSGRRFIALQSVMDEQYQIIPELYNRKIINNFRHVMQLIAATVGTGALALIAVAWPSKQQDTVLRLVVLVYIVTFLVFLALYQHYFPNVHGLRYMVFLGYILTIFLAHAAHRLVQLRQGLRYRRLAYSSILIALLLLGMWHYREVDGNLPVWPADGEVVWRTQLNDWVNENLPAGTRFAAKDHGQLSYFTPVEVVDLAGIIQPELVDYLKEGKIEAFLEENEVEYILLNDKSTHRVFTEAYARLDLGEPVLRVRESGAVDTWEVYRLFGD